MSTGWTQRAMSEQTPMTAERLAQLRNLVHADDPREPRGRIVRECLDEIDRQRAEIERLSKDLSAAVTLHLKLRARIYELERACKWAANEFSRQTSADGSGHADLGHMLLNKTVLLPPTPEEADAEMARAAEAMSHLASAPQEDTSQGDDGDDGPDNLTELEPSTRR